MLACDKGTSRASVPVSSGHCDAYTLTSVFRLCGVELVTNGWPTAMIVGIHASKRLAQSTCRIGKVSAIRNKRKLTRLPCV